MKMAYEVEYKLKGLKYTAIKVKENLSYWVTYGLKTSPTPRIFK